jgi:predicted RNA-binding Zn-ribbon protein involved in translation (DUF1610 family)
MPRKIYGQSRDDKCVFCSIQASVKNSQGFPTCISHKNKVMDDKKCTCGEWMDIKQSKWGAFFLCPNCGPRSLSKTENMETTGYKLNKKFRNENVVRKKINYDPNKLYTIDELEMMWGNH